MIRVGEAGKASRHLAVRFGPLELAVEGRRGNQRQISLNGSGDMAV